MCKNSPDDDNSDTWWPLLKINDYTTRVCLIQIAVARHGELIFNIRADILCNALFTPNTQSVAGNCLALSVISKFFHVLRIECDSRGDSIMILISLCVGLSIQ